MTDSAAAPATLDERAGAPSTADAAPAGAACGATPRECANALRFLAIDAVEAAQSGHPGMPMGMADIAEVLWRRHLRHSPANPSWPDRDRFVLSNGHGSMLLYALLHLSGYDLPRDELRRFRQLHSRTPGHPEADVTPGVETTTGPLGQGLANAVGMALAERLLAAEFNRPGLPVVDHRTWVFVGDGCLMEGISQEACSLAGTLGLERLVAIYDDNRISIDGDVDGWFRDDTPARFRACGWNVIGPVDGHDAAAVDRALHAARASTGRPTLVVCRTHIGFGSPNCVDSAQAHGAALGAQETAATREALGWPHPPFEVPRAIERAWDARAAGDAIEQAWRHRMAAYAYAYPEQAAELSRRLASELPADFASVRAALEAAALAPGKPVATRKASQQVLERLVAALPELIGGSADLSGSNLTQVGASRAFADGAQPFNYLNYGVREFGMAAVMNGLALHGGFIPYGGTFLVFSDYSRNAIRMAALMHRRVIHVLTHDSIGLGEDGPTHQPIEHAASLRLIPNLRVWRPCDLAETTVAWLDAIARRDAPSALLLSRQALPTVEREAAALDAIGRGGYVLDDTAGEPDVVLIATGSEVAVARQARALLADRGIAARVVSMPCTQAFDAQDAGWRDAVLARGVPRVAVEAGHPDFWRKYVGLEGAVVGIDRFGESAPADALFRHFGITARRVADAAMEVIQCSRP